MTTSDIVQSLKQADDDLQRAGSELYRPQDHVVTISVCHHTQDTMKRMMSLYLQNHGITTNENASLEELYDQCYRKNPDFIRADIAHIDCKDLDATVRSDKYCFSVENVTCCTNIAQQLKAVIWDELKIN